MASKQLSVEDGSPELLEPVSLTFKNIGFSVKDRRTGATVQILKGIDGRVSGTGGPGTRVLRPSFLWHSCSSVWCSRLLECVDISRTPHPCVGNPLLLAPAAAAKDFGAAPAAAMLSPHMPLFSECVQIEPKRLMVIMGSSGAGKTTLVGAGECCGCGCAPPAARAPRTYPAA